MLKTENLVVEACVKDARPVKVEAPVNALVPVVVKFPATVELAWETNPLAKVARSVRLRVPAERTPMFPFVLKRFVLDAVVEKRLVVVALPSVTVPAVKFVEYRFVLDAVVEKRFVVVAFESVVLPVTPRVPATERLPAESKVEVAVPPKYAVPKLEKLVVEAPAEKSWRAVQVLADARSWELGVRQFPSTAKHPPSRSMPRAKVDVADVPVTLRYVEVKPPEKVEVELVPATFRKPWSVEVPVVSPCTVVVAEPPT